MFARGDERRHRQPAWPAVAGFRCSACARPLELEEIVATDAERGDDGVTGYVLFRHHCACSPGKVRTSRSWATHAAFVALFGSQPWLPYRSPFQYQAVAHDHPDLARWRWELDQVADVEEFILFLDAAPR